MIEGKTVLGIIPARGGSKGLPGKNTKLLCGKPLIGWSIEKAKKSRYLDLTLVTTDNREIAEISSKLGAYVPFLRPAELASDTSTTLEAVVHALEYLAEKENRTFDIIVLLEPTSPLREDDDIDKMLEKYINVEDQFDSIVSIGEVDEHPAIVKRVVDNSLEPFCPELMQTTRRQDNEPAYFPYGVAYMVKTKALLAEKTFYTKRCTYYRLKRYQNFEIDSIYDFLCIENIMKYEWGLE